MAKKKSPPSAGRQLTCFVVIGFGLKTDLATGRVLDLDKTYEQLIRPAFDDVDVNCFRAIDANLTGSIESIMYQWIFQADIVIADLSTLNANVFYELGVRHAQKPNTTIIIAESELMARLPFDLNHFVVHQYHHGGEEISAHEQKRFRAHLGGVLKDILATEEKRLADGGAKERLADSPVYTFLTGMEPPAYRSRTQLEPPAYVPPAERERREPKPGKSLSSVIEAAEAAKNAKRFDEAIELFSRAIEMETRPDPDDPGKRKREKPDVFLAQRLALVTYKKAENDLADGKIDEREAVKALREAEKILSRLCDPPPGISTDPETLGLSGAINKRLFEIEKDRVFIDRAIGFYERGFYVKQDYYNGINVAFMYTIRSLQRKNRIDAIVDYGHANMIRRRVGEICGDIRRDEASFAERGDRPWVLTTLAEVHHGLGESSDEKRIIQVIKDEAPPFVLDSYERQRVLLAAAIEEYARRVRPDEISWQAAGAAPPAASHGAPDTEPAADLVENAEVLAGEPETRTVASSVRRSATGDIVIDANIARGRTIKSIDVHCKIEYS